VTTLAFYLLGSGAAFALTGYLRAADFCRDGLADFIGLLAKGLELVAKNLKLPDSLSVCFFRHDIEPSINNSVR